MQERDIRVQFCKLAVKKAMNNCKYGADKCEGFQFVIFSLEAYEEALVDNLDSGGDVPLEAYADIAKDTYCKAYEEAQKWLGNKSQVLQSMLWEDKFTSFDVAYGIIADRVESAAGVPALPESQESEAV